MRGRILGRSILGQVLVGLGGAALLGLAPLGAVRAEAPDPETILDLEATRLSGRSEALADYRGQVLLVVNTASECGYTPQYAGLETVYEKYRERGFNILGFPSNDFGAQEPGTDAEIGAFCERNYGVEFPMFSKVKVRGEGQHPVYAFLTSEPAPVGGPVRWNFEKYLVDRSGAVVHRFPSATKPTSPELLEAIEALLVAASATGAPGKERTNSSLD